MFHGPAYQGVVALGPVGDDGVDGAIDVLPAPRRAARLRRPADGWWVMQHETRDRLAMPVRVERVALFGARARGRHPCRLPRADAPRRRAGGARRPRGSRPASRVREYHRLGGPPVRQRRRGVGRADVPERHALAEPAPGGYVVARERWRAAASRAAARCGATSARPSARARRRRPRPPRGWLLGRIAAKDAVRRALWAATRRSAIFPVEIEVETGADGRPVLRGPIAGRLVAAVAEEDGIAAAVVAAGRAGVAAIGEWARARRGPRPRRGAGGRDRGRGRCEGGDAPRRRLHHRIDVHVIDSERNPEKVLEVMVAALVREVIGDDGGLGPPIAMKT